MKARYLVGCILIAGGIAFFLIRSAHKPKADTQQGVVQGPKTNAPETNPPLAMAEAQKPPVGKVHATNGPLAGAYEMAAFIDQVRDSVPSERFSTRSHLKGLQVALFLSDYVIAAKTNESLALTKSAIIDAFMNVSEDTSIISDRLVTYAERPGTLSDHYQSISKIPTEKDNIKAIKAALVENGFAIDTEGDLLMDCIRYAYSITFFQEMYGPNPRRIEEATPYPPALNALVNASDIVFRHRFETRFGLKPDAVTNLMNRLRDVRLYDVSPADMQIPAHLR